MKLKKESKIRILENFYSLDYTLFGKPVTKMDLCCPSFIEEYMSVKGALMSLVIEMYQLMKHSPRVINEKVDTSTLLKNAKNSAIVARENCQKLVTSAKGRKEVKENLRESLAKSGKNVDIENLVHEKIRAKSFSLAVDNLLIGRAITESKKFDKLNTWNGRILEDAYKILRDNLVESAMTIIEISQPEPKKKVVSEVDAFTVGNVAAGIGATALVGTLGYSVYIYRKRLADKKYKECLYGCDKYSPWTGNFQTCARDCVKEYKARMKKAKESLQKEKNKG